MIQFIAFAVIYGAMMFIWTYVYLNQSKDKVNQTFLYFISLIILWMVLDLCNVYQNSSVLGLALKTVYWISMMNLAVLFLLFAYRLVGRKLDAAFYALLAINTLTIAARYFFPMDYAAPAFWRLSQPVIAPLMSAIFTLPAVYAMILIIRRAFLTKDPRERAQLACMFWGMGAAGAVSVVSEYILPGVIHLHARFPLMYVAILIFVTFTFVSIRRYKLLYIRWEYVYRTLLLSSPDGVVLVDKNRKVACINDAARRALHNERIEIGDSISDYIPDYAFETNYKQREASLVTASGETIQLSLTQFAIDPEDPRSARMITVSDVTLLKKEKDILVEKSRTDPLTGFYTKQFFTELYEDAPAEAGEDFSILFIDIDNFKAINDTYGHPTGDRVLKETADCIKKSLRSGSKIVRFGGDEFIVLLENTSAGNAFLVAERIRDNVLRMEMAESAPDQRPSLSIGVANSALLETRSVNELIKMADAAMYRSKSVGKNKTTIFTQQAGGTPTWAD